MIMRSWTVDFVSEEAAEEFSALPADMRAKLQRTFDLVESRGLAALVMPLARVVEGRIWEFRVSGRDGIARSLYAAASGQTLLVLRTFIKKTPKTPRREIEIAKRRLLEDENVTH
jgi:phage-related protein